MKMQLLAVCLFMPILACSAQFDWLMNYRVHNVGAPQQQREFGFIKPSTTPKPLAAGPKQRRDGIFGIGTAAEFVGGSSSFTPLDTAPVDNPVAEAPGDSSTGTQGSDWDINLGGTDYGGDSGGAAGGGGGGAGGAGGASGGTGGLGGTSGASGGTFADGGNLNPGYDDSIQKLANGASAGSIAGIVIGVIILLSVLAGISFFVMRQVHRKVQVNVTRA